LRGRFILLLLSLSLLLFFLALPLLGFLAGGDETFAGGSLDAVTGAVISGWAWDGKQPTSPVAVDIFDGDTRLATVRADLFREDLLLAQMGDGKHGFRYPTPAGLQDGKPHTIRVRIAGIGKDLDGSPKSLRPKDTTPDGAGRIDGETVAGSLDGVTGAVISGWAWDRQQPDSPIAVDLFDGDTMLATVRAALFRKDLLQEKIGDGKHGFLYPTPAALKDGKSHTIRAKIAGTGVELAGSPQTFRIP
jgi:hypothetical protein